MIFPDARISQLSRERAVRREAFERSRAQLSRAAREEVGPDVDLMVDGGWYGTDYQNPFKARSLSDWIKLIHCLEDLGVFWLEDCLHPENVGLHVLDERVEYAGEQIRHRRQW